MYDARREIQEQKESLYQYRAVELSELQHRCACQEKEIDRLRKLIDNMGAIALAELKRE